ncbi:hypothetical protein ABW19_dt0203661 [Dactylella cylindrospora]|nr:hypothetical protein ABW19_dt0203661 [Dactylella cylindrospora]
MANESNLVGWAIAVPVVSMVLCTTGVALRLFTRLKYANQVLYLEDWLLIGPAYIGFMGAAITLIVGTTYGLGSHIDQGISKDEIVKLMKTIYAMQIPLFISLGAIRTSLLLFVQRLSRNASRTLYLILYALIPFNIVHITVATFVSIFRCNPISDVWNLDTLNYSCMHPAVGTTLVAFGLAIDIAIFILPAILVVRLNISKKKKLQSIVMFALGGGGCIIEGLRFDQLNTARYSPDITYTSAVVMIFIFFQAVLGMLCCCAPAVKVFATRLTDSRFKCSKHLGSHSDDLRGTAGRDASKARHLEDDLERGQEESSKRTSMLPTSAERSTPEQPAEDIEMDIQRSGVTSESSKKDGAVVVERIMDLKEILKMDDINEHQGSWLEVQQDGEVSGTATSNSSQTYEEFQATPVEWGRQL